MSVRIVRSKNDVVQPKIYKRQYVNHVLCLQTRQIQLVIVQIALPKNRRDFDCVFFGVMLNAALTMSTKV